LEQTLAPARALARWRILLVAIALAAALLGTVARSQAASATSVTYCFAQYLAGGDHCDAPDRHSLTANQAWQYNGAAFRVCAGATLNGSFYLDYACGTTFAEHCYDGSQLIVGRVHNGETFGQTLKGVYFYSETCP
jgi:hypothetical protein